jgi:hypothetical protein
MSAKTLFLNLNTQTDAMTGYLCSENLEVFLQTNTNTRAMYV